MPCPYAERKGPAVYCRVIGRKVNPLAFPCLTNKYERCRYYRRAKAQAREAAEEAGREPEPRPAPRPVQAPPPGLPEPPRRAKGEVKGLTIDGRKPASCRECIYYGARTRTCLLLGITVEDPDDPPCARV